MKYCKQCGKEMADGLLKCPNCGAAADGPGFSKWSAGLIACDVIAVLTLFLGWVKIGVFGISETVSPVRLVGYLRDADSVLRYYLSGYSDKVNLIMLGGVCLIAVYAASVLLTLMKKDYAFFVGMLAHLVMLFFSGEVANAVKKLTALTNQAISVSGVVYLVFILSMAASALCFYVFALHPELAGGDS